MEVNDNIDSNSHNDNDTIETFFNLQTIGSLQGPQKAWKAFSHLVALPPRPGSQRKIDTIV